MTAQSIRAPNTIYPVLEALQTADLLILFIRWRDLPMSR